MSIRVRWHNGRSVSWGNRGHCALGCPRTCKISRLTDSRDFSPPESQPWSTLSVRGSQWALKRLEQNRERWWQRPESLAVPGELRACSVGALSRGHCPWFLWNTVALRSPPLWEGNCLSHEAQSHSLGRGAQKNRISCQQKPWNFQPRFGYQISVHFWKGFYCMRTFFFLEFVTIIFEPVVMALITFLWIIYSYLLCIFLYCGFGLFLTDL